MWPRALAAVRGVQFEVLASLTLVMVTATGLLAAFMVRTQAIQVEQLRGMIGRALVAEAEAPGFRYVGGQGPTVWWIEQGGELRPVGVQADGGPEDPALLEIASEARSAGEPVLGVGRPWEPLRFAAPIGAGKALTEVAVARIPPAVSGSLLLGLVIADCAIFIAMGAYLLRRRVLVGLKGLAEGARAVAEGESGTRVRVEGSRETVAVAHAFNEMTEALEARGQELEKAIGELRATNRSLRTARDGLDRSERLASVGSLAAGVAHEVGNPMGALLAFLDLASRDEAISDTTRAHLSRASEQGARVREILRQLLDFSRPPRAQRVEVDLVALAEQAVGLVRAQKRYEGIAYEVRGEALAAHAVGDESIVAQILLNLVINASDAVRAQSQPRVELVVRPAVLSVRSGDDSAAVALRRRQADGVECCVFDNGPGVAEEDRERIFDPFYTSKDPGEGTGLGLANALRLSEQLGGSVELLAECPLGGAAFALRLPIETEERTAVRESR